MNIANILSLGLDTTVSAVIPTRNPRLDAMSAKHMADRTTTYRAHMAATRAIVAETALLERAEREYAARAADFDALCIEVDAAPLNVKSGWGAMSYGIVALGLYTIATCYAVAVFGL